MPNLTLGFYPELRTTGGYIETAPSGDLASLYPTMKFTLKIPVTKVATAMDSFEELVNPTAMSVSMQDVPISILLKVSALASLPQERYSRPSS